MYLVTGGAGFIGSKPVAAFTAIRKAAPVTPLEDGVGRHPHDRPMRDDPHR